VGIIPGSGLLTETGATGALRMPEAPCWWFEGKVKTGAGAELDGVTLTEKGGSRLTGMMVGPVNGDAHSLNVR